MVDSSAKTSNPTTRKEQCYLLLSSNDQMRYADFRNVIHL